MFAEALEGVVVMLEFAERKEGVELAVANHVDPESFATAETLGHQVVFVQAEAFDHLASAEGAGTDAILVLAHSVASSGEREFARL